MGTSRAWWQASRCSRQSTARSTSGDSTVEDLVRERTAVRLLFITGSLVHGGAERHTITLANRLAERGHECHAAYVKDDPSQRERYRGMASLTCLDARRY